VSNFVTSMQQAQIDLFLNQAEREFGVRSLRALDPTYDWEAKAQHIAEWLYVEALWLGLPEAVAHFEQCHEPLLRRWLQKYGVPAQELDDAFCELREQLYPFYCGIDELPSGMRLYRWQGTLDRFLHACARQFARKWMRKAKAHGVPGYDPRVALECDLADKDKDKETADDPRIAEQVIQRLDLEQALNALRPRARQCLQLLAEGFTEREIAQRLGMTAANANKTIHRARQRMREALADYAPKKVELGCPCFGAGKHSY